MPLITGYIDFPNKPPNQRFTFYVNNQTDAINCKLRLQRKGCHIRASWYFDKKRMLSPIKI